MSERQNNFDLKLLTASKDVGLRRLRSYSASLGGGAQIFHSYDDLRRHLENLALDGCSQAKQHIVLHDHSVALSPAQVTDLHRRVRVFALDKPLATAPVLPQQDAAVWRSEAYLRCSLEAFLDSPVIRLSMAHMCRADQPFKLAQLLRWGHAQATWQLSAGRGPEAVADAGLQFTRRLNLTGEGRRLTEMFSHFTAARLPSLNLTSQSVTFGSDGLLIVVSARCRAEDGMSVRAVCEELRIHDFPIAVVNQLGPSDFEIAGLFHQLTPDAGVAERVMMVFDKVDTATPVDLSPPTTNNHTTKKAG